MQLDPGQVQAAFVAGLFLLGLSLLYLHVQTPSLVGDSSALANKPDGIP